MKKPTLYTLLLIFSLLIAVGTFILRISHVISSHLAYLLFALVIILHFVANRSKARQKN
ncbi:hypothetical protein BD749_1586 [Pontibacter ramchanderi]|uniref:Uncharacterized protein n=1 Tax=Pontibacter ramchanderi TaxID=1179743 RepID=A0A2N3UAR4_9BACT|nr:hypothetical protein BD749_1586 [Pontibacter ramchanderi]